MRRRFFSGLMVLGLCAGTVWAQGNFVYTNDDWFPNTVSAFSVGKDGVLALVPGSPFRTGGNGGDERRPRFFASNRIRVIHNFLYASNCATNNVSGFWIDPETGRLTPVPGSPFSTGGLCDGGISLAVTPDGQFLYAGNDFSQDLSLFHIGSEGELIRVGDRVPAGRGINGMVVSPNGRWLAVALSFEDPHGAVAMFHIDPNTGELAQVEGSPFPPREPGGPEGRAAGVDINCASDTLFVGEGRLPGTTIVDVLSIDGKTGALIPIKGSPFMPGVGENSNVVLLSPDDSLLFVSNTFGRSVTVFTVAEDGSLTLVPGSPFDARGGPNGMATTLAGAFLDLTRHLPDSVIVLSIDGSGALTPVPGSPFPTGRPGRLFSLAAYPAKICSGKTK